MVKNTWSLLNFFKKWNELLYLRKSLKKNTLFKKIFGLGRNDDSLQSLAFSSPLGKLFCYRMIRNMGKKKSRFIFSRNNGFLLGLLWNVVVHIWKCKDETADHTRSPSWETYWNTYWNTSLKRKKTWSKYNN